MTDMVTKEQMIERMAEQSPAVRALVAYKQADMDGVMILASRQAVHEIVDEREALINRIEKLEAVAEAAKEWGAKRGRDAGLFHIAEDRLERALAAFAAKES